MEKFMTKEFAPTLEPPVAPQSAVYAALPDDELLPCPCCGGEAQEYDRFNANRVSCKSCGLYLRQSEQGSGDAAARWNRRASHGQASAQAAPAAVAGPSEFPHEKMDAVALGRYKAVSSDQSMFYRFAVVAGDGAQQLYIGREVDCLNMARKFAGAFLDGAFAYHSMTAAPTTQPAPAAVAGPSEAVKFTDQSTADPVEKARRYLTAMGRNHLHSSYFFDDGYPKQESATDALATLAVLEQLAAAPTTKPAPQQEAQEAQTPAHIKAMERAWLWMENQADSQSKGGNATFDLMMLREERDALRAALAAAPTAYPSHAAQSIESDGWLHENGLLYRLTDERYPTNRDEINVTMADGSRSIESRSRRALELLNRIRGAEQ